MKAHSLKLALVAIAVCAVVMTAIHPLAFDAAGAHLFQASTLAVVALATLRADHADLLTRATAKRAELKDGLTADQIRAIEDAHGKLVAEADAKKREIEAAEAAERAKPTEHAWTRSDIQKIGARAAGFGLTAAVAAEIMADDKIRSIEEATDALQERAVKAKPSERQVPHARILRDEGDTLREAVTAAITLRAAPQAYKADSKERELARPWRGMSLLETGRQFMLDAHGLDLRGMSRMELARALLGMDPNVRSAGMHSTSDFANLLANVASKRLRNAYDLAPQLWKKIGRQSNNPDFKQKSVVQLSSAPAFKLVREGAEFTYGGLTDGVEKYALATYGRIIAITRQTLINDDLSAFDRLPMLLGRQAAELEASTFWSILTANAAMNDSVALFHASHGNLLTGSAIDTTNLGLMRAAMRKQKALAAKSADAEPLNLTMKYIVVSPDKETEAAQAVTAVLATQIDKVNVFAGTLEVIPEARLTGNTWFGIADPATVDTIEYAYLEGEEGVYTEQRIGFEVDGIEVKGRVDFAAKAIDWRGMAKNPGN